MADEGGALDVQCIEQTFEVSDELGNAVGINTGRNVALTVAAHVGRNSAITCSS